MSMSAYAPLSWRQVKTLTKASIKARYRNTFAGVLWVVLSPLLMFSAQGYAFKFVLRIKFDNYPLFLLSGLLPWIFFIQSIQMGTTIFVVHGRLLKSFPLHPLVCLISLILDNLINFSLTFVLILLPLLFFTEGATVSHFLLIPLPLLSLLIATVGSAWFLATLQVFFHDTRYIVDFVSSIAFYLTPIFYPKQFVGPEWYALVDYNPLAILLTPLQALSRTQLPDDFVFSVFASFGVSLSIFALAFVFWYRKKNLVYLYL